MNWGSLSGNFANLELPLNGHIVWDTSHLYDAGALSVVATYYAGDFNRDGHVDAADIGAAMSALTNLTGYESQYGITAANLPLIDDVNGDGSFTNADLQSLLDTLKSGSGSQKPIPEPSTFALFSLGTLLGAIFKRRKTFHRNCR